MNNTVKKLILGVLVLCLFTGLVFPEKIGELKDVLKPVQMRVDGKTLFLSEQNYIFFYAMDTLKRLHKVGGIGGGPGQFPYEPRLKIKGDRLLAYAMNRVAFFSKTGELLKEKRTNKIFMRIDYMDGNYVVPISNITEDELGFYTTDYAICDPDFNKIKTIHSEKQRAYRRRQTREKRPILRPLTTCQCLKGKIYLVNGKKGFSISAFDSKGNLLKEIHRNDEKLKVTETEKKRIFDEFVSNPVIKKRWRILNKMYEYVVPDYYPPIQGFRIANERMYIKTYRSVKGKTEFLILDLNGKELGKYFLPDIKEKFYDIAGEWFYFLKEDEDEEVWSFHRVKIK